MLGDDTRAGERRETMEELSNLLLVLQRMGHRLSYETHEAAYDSVREFNELLHEARRKLSLIEAN